MTLTIQDLGALGELLGSIAVLVTLIYLAFQTRQNTMAIGAQVDAAAIHGVHTHFLTLATSTELQEALNEDRVNPREVNELRRLQFWTSQFVTFQWQVAQAQRGLLPFFNEPAVAAAVRGHFSSFRSFEGWWERAKENYGPEFVGWVEELLAYHAQGQIRPLVDRVFPLEEAAQAHHYLHDRQNLGKVLLEP